VRSAARLVELDADSAELLDRHLVAIAEQPRASSVEHPSTAEQPRASSAQPPSSTTEPPRDIQLAQQRPADRDVVIIAGMPAAGKTTLAFDYAARGYVRLNRDERGGSLLDLARVLDRELAAGATHVVLDNTYATRASRAPVIEVAKRHDVPVRCLVVTTTLEQAQANAVARMLELHGRLLEPDEMRKTATIAPSAQFRYRREYEPPRADEGFVSVEDIGFVAREMRRAPATVTAASTEDTQGPTTSTSTTNDTQGPTTTTSTTNDTQGPTTSTPTTNDTAFAARRPALLVELDDIVWAGRPIRIHQLALLPGIREALQRWHDAGYVLAGTTWQTSPSLDELLPEQLGLPFVIARCRHPAGPPVCWCRKPMPGLALLLAHKHGLDLARSVHIGKGAADRGFATRAGLRYFDIADGFPAPDAAVTPANSAS
jgi:phosphoglycolate phosphatase-like HAD superfamily hydrolase